MCKNVSLSVNNAMIVVNVAGILKYVTHSLVDSIKNTNFNTLNLRGNKRMWTEIDSPLDVVSAYLKASCRTTSVLRFTMKHECS